MIGNRDIVGLGEIVLDLANTIEDLNEDQAKTLAKNIVSYMIKHGSGSGYDLDDPKSIDYLRSSLRC